LDKQNKVSQQFFSLLPEKGELNIRLFTGCEPINFKAMKNDIFSQMYSDAKYVCNLMGYDFSSRYPSIGQWDKEFIFKY
jgi:hypothetical protein